MLGRKNSTREELDRATATSLMDGGGVLQSSTVIKPVPETSVLKLAVGDRIRLSAAQFAQLSRAFLAELEARFV